MITPLIVVFAYLFLFSPLGVATTFVVCIKQLVAGVHRWHETGGRLVTILFGILLLVLLLLIALVLIALVTQPVGSAISSALWWLIPLGGVGLITALVVCMKRVVAEFHRRHETGGRLVAILVAIPFGVVLLWLVSIVTRSVAFSIW